MSRDIKQWSIAHFIRHWNEHSYDVIEAVNPNRFVSYGHFLAYIANQIKHGTYDRHSHIELKASPRAVVLPTYNNYNYVFCAHSTATTEAFYDVMRTLSKASRKWVLDLTAITKVRDMLYWILPFITHQNVLEFDYAGRHYDVSASICVVSGYSNTTFSVSPWSEKVPWESINFVCGQGNLSLLLKIFSGRGQDNYRIFISEALIPRFNIATEDIVIADERITLSLLNPEDTILANHEKITNSDLPSELWPYHPDRAL